MMSDEQYTVCFDAWRHEIQKLNPSLTLIGPEFVSGPNKLPSRLPSFEYFLNASNHADRQPPEVISFHVSPGGYPTGSRSWAPGGMFATFDRWRDGFVRPLEALRQQLAPNASLVMNEYIAENEEWCEEPPCPDASQANATGMKINRSTLGWNAAAAAYAYAFGQLSEFGFLYVTADQLVAGPWPNNCPFVASLDWTTGEPNAKYWGVRMLAKALGKAPRDLYASSVSSNAWGMPWG